jgi:hypothetical protein
MSQKLDLEIIESPFYSLSKFGWVDFVILLASFAFLMLVWESYQNRQATFIELESKLNHLNQQNQKKPSVKQVNTTISPEEFNQLQETVGLLTTPWNELFDAIEQSDMPDITLLGLEPDSKKQRVIITGEAKNLQTILDYIVRLEKQSVFAQVLLQKHQVDQANSFKPVGFTAVANWNVTQ